LPEAICSIGSTIGILRDVIRSTPFFVSPFSCASQPGCQVEAAMVACHPDRHARLVLHLDKLMRALTLAQLRISVGAPRRVHFGSWLQVAVIR
jgi:hypothetical protein